MRPVTPPTDYAPRILEQAVFLPVFAEEDVQRYARLCEDMLALHRIHAPAVVRGHLSRCLLDVAYQLYRRPVATLDCLPVDRRTPRRVRTIRLPVLSEEEARDNRETILRRHRQWNIDDRATARLAALTLLVAVGSLATGGRLGVGAPPGRCPGR